MKKPQHIYIHHTAVSYKKNPDQAVATDRYHKEKWGVRSSLGFYGGYNYEIAANGKVTQFRKEGEYTVAQYQKNMNNGQAISICLDMNGDIEDPTPQQIFELRNLLGKIQQRYKIKRSNIFFHRDIAPYKSCPGKRMNREWIRNNLALTPT